MTLAYNTTSPPAGPDRTLTGHVLEGRYAIGLPLGAGGMGTVYAGKQLRLDREVAIKVLDPSFSRTSEAAVRFIREAKLLSRVRHPNVIQVLDYGETNDGLMYCVMELLVGSDLEQLEARMPHGCMPWPGACDLLAQIADGLGAVHMRGIVHRDIKPSNCFVSFEEGNTPVVKLLDFGVARSETGDVNGQLTQAGLLLGTPSHIAPELLTTKNPATPASDLYALGVVAYRLLSGKLPFVGDTLFAQMNAACTSDPLPLDDPDLDIPVELQQLVMGLLDKDPAKRPKDARVVGSRFRLVAGHGASATLPLDLPVAPSPSDVRQSYSPPPAPINLEFEDLEGPPTESTIPVPRSEQESLEAFDLDEVELQEVLPWYQDRRLWVIGALLLGVMLLTVAVAFTDDPEPPPAPTSTDS